MPGQSNRGFAERVALVTDVGDDAGRAVALQLALEGAYVIVGYGEAASGAEGERVAQELREIGTLAHAFRACVWQPEGVRRLFALIEETFGRLDLLVNSAHDACEPTATLDKLTAEAWERAFDVNLKSAFLCSQAAARLMRPRPKAAICNIASEAGLATGPARFGPHYVAAQAGLIGLTRALARSLAPGIRVNCVAPYEIAPPDVSEGQARRAVAPYSARPRDVARACLYLLSPEAGTITGQTLVVGGEP